MQSQLGQEGQIYTPMQEIKHNALLKGVSSANSLAYNSLQINPVTLSWKDLTYDVRVSRKNPQTGQSEVIDKRILD
eukprot:733893-Hanusia_phi.AAC.1